MTERDQLDAQVAFFLEHEGQLREWMALESGAQRAFNDFLLSMVDDVRALAVQLGDDVAVTDPSEDGWGTYAVLGLYRPSWLLAGERPAACVALVWHRTRATFRGSTGFHPCCAVWARVAADGGALAKQLRAVVAPAVRELDGAAQANLRWVAWRAEPPATDRFWEDLRAYRNQLLARLESVWGAADGPITAVVAPTPPA